MAQRPVQATAGRHRGFEGSPAAPVKREAGFTLPYVIVMSAISLMAVSSVAFLSVHFRSVAATEDGERLYYSMDAAVEQVFADLVRGADALDSSYATPTVAINDVTSTISVAAPGAVAAPTSTQQYFDPGVKNPELRDGVVDTSYILHIYNIVPTSTLDVNWAFELSGASPSVTAKIRVFDNQEAATPGRNTGCPTGNKLAQVNQSFSGAGIYNVRIEDLQLTEIDTYTIAFCISALTDTFTTRDYQPSAQAEDTWVYAIAYKITAAADGAFVTTWVRQMPGLTQPSAGNWSDTNISWTTNLVTPYRWDR